MDPDLRPIRYVVVVSDPDPVARAVAEAWGTRPAMAATHHGAPLRRLNGETAIWHRPSLHIRDDHLDRELPPPLRTSATLVFPSVHRSESRIDCLTIHPLWNLTEEAEVGGAGRTLVPAPARVMAGLLRRLQEGSSTAGLPATFEATHHGPLLERPACFAEIGCGDDGPPAAAVPVLRAALETLDEDPTDRVAVAAGGGHYAPHFTDLALRRRWAFGHIVPRHHLSAEAVSAAVAATPGQEGVVYARTADAGAPGLREIAPRLRETEAPRRVPLTEGGTSASPTSGT